MPINPGTFNLLSKQGLDAIAGNTQNRIPGEYIKRKFISLSILKSDLKSLNVKRIKKVVNNQPRKFKKGTP